MWIGDYYIKPLYILILIAVIVVVAVITIIKKLIVTIIAIIIMSFVVYGGNNAILNNQTEKIAKLINVGKSSFDKVKSMIDNNVIKVENGETYIKVEDTWYPYKEIKDKLIKVGENFVFKGAKGDIEIKNNDLNGFLKDIK